MLFNSWVQSASTLTHARPEILIKISSEFFYTYVSTYKALTQSPFQFCGYFYPKHKVQRFLKSIETLSCWYLLDSSRWVLLNEYPFARVSVSFLYNFVFVKFTSSSKRVKLQDIRRDILKCHLLRVSILLKNNLKLQDF